MDEWKQPTLDDCRRSIMVKHIAALCSMPEENANFWVCNPFCIPWGHMAEGSSQIPMNCPKWYCQSTYNKAATTDILSSCILWIVQWICHLEDPSCPWPIGWNMLILCLWTNMKGTSKQKMEMWVTKELCGINLFGSQVRSICINTCGRTYHYSQCNRLWYTTCNWLPPQYIWTLEACAGQEVQLAVMMDGGQLAWKVTQISWGIKFMDRRTEDPGDEN